MNNHFRNANQFVVDQECASRTTIPITLCAPSRKNVLSTGLTLIQVRSFQLPALAHHVSAAENSLQCNCKIIFFLTVVQGVQLKYCDLHGHTRFGRKKAPSAWRSRLVFCIFVAKQAAEAPVRARAMEGGSEKEGKVFCASPPPHQSKGEMSQPKGGKNMKANCAKLLICNH